MLPVGRMCYNTVTARDTVTFSNEELEEMKANDAVVIVSCDDDNGHRLY